MGSSKMSSDSSSEEEGDAERRAAIASIVSTSSFSTSSKLTNGIATPNSNHSTEDQTIKLNPQFKFSQIRLRHYRFPDKTPSQAQKMLDSIIEKTLEIVNERTHVGPEEPAIEEGGVRLFRDAPVGIVFDHIVELQGPTKRPKILPGEEINKKSKKFRKQIKSVVVDGSSIISAAEDACEKSLLRLRDKEARAKAAAKKEEERVAGLKKIRGEKWLPSIARDKAS